MVSEMVLLACSVSQMAMASSIRASRSVFGCASSTRRFRQLITPCRPQWKQQLLGVKQQRQQQSAAHPTRARRTPACNAQPDGSEGAVFQGAYGPWSIDADDVAEVTSYRAGLTLLVAAFVATAAITHSISAESDAAGAAGGATGALLNGLWLAGAGGLGLSLVQIHIYVTEIKRTIQALWLLGVLGGLGVAATHPEAPLPLFVADHAWAMWCVGPAAAAVTGVAIKEGLCYGKPEAAGLALLLPLLCLAHLGSAPAALQDTLLLAVAVVACVFAARKWTQPVKDDIGDKSVFTFRKLSPDQQQEVLRQLKAQEGSP